MKIDLSKYPPGTKFQLCNKKIVTLIGKSFAKDGYIIEHSNGELGFRNQEGKCSPQSDVNIESAIQPDKYLVAFRRKSGEIDTEIVVEPQVLKSDYFLKNLHGKYALGALGMSIPEKILSWSKIEE